MVKALHRAGIEVILDVVYNHTAEGNHLGPMLAFRGIDNASYYRLMPDDPSRYIDFTGTGNSLNPVHPSVLRLIMDSLRYWVTECHVDGFRFDLASALARELYDVDRLSAFFDVIHQDPVLSQVKLIAEPWDLGPGGYQVGNFPVLWTEWNDHYRDTMRDVWRGETSVAAFASRFTGSSDLYEADGRHPSASINFITAHDGFTLADLVSYNEKHNEANLEDNRDGTDDNRSWNCGVEGPTDDPEVDRAARAPAAQLPRDAAALAGRADARRRRRDGPHAARQQQRLVPGQRDLLGRLGARRGRRGAARVHAPAARAAPPAPDLPSHAVPRRRGSASGLPDAWWFRPDGRRMTAARLAEPGAHALGVFLNGRGIGSVEPRGRADRRLARSCSCSTPTTRTSRSRCRRAASGRAGRSSSRPSTRARPRRCSRRAARRTSEPARSCCCAQPDAPAPS